jgi:hypothetical protein
MLYPIQHSQTFREAYGSNKPVTKVMSSLTSKPGPWLVALHLLFDVCYTAAVRPDVVSYSAFVLGTGENQGHKKWTHKRGVSILGC